MEIFWVAGAILAWVTIAFDLKLLSALKKSDNNVFLSLGSPGILGTPKKYKFWYGFILLGGYKKHILSSESLWLCKVNQALLVLLHLFIIYWFILVGIGS